MEKNKKKVENEELKRKKEQKHREKLEILAKADEIKEQTFIFDDTGNLSLKKEIEELFSDPIDNPEEKYELYYKVLMKTLKRHLPKGLENKPARDMIYEEKNTFLTRGHRKNEQGIRGQDSRMSYIADIREIIVIVTEWVVTNGTMFELYDKLRNLNIEKGYGDPLVKK